MSTTVLQVSYDFYLILVALVAGVFASYTAFSLLPLSTCRRNRYHHLWLLASSVSLGLGMWMLYFISIIAFSLPFPMKYNALLAIMSLGFAIFASGQAFHLVVEAQEARVSVERTLLCSVLVGLGIVTVHYMGMAAISVPAKIQYNWFLFLVSIVVAISASHVTILLLLWLHRVDSSCRRLANFVSALVFSVGVVLVHFTGMNAAAFLPSKLSNRLPALLLNAAFLGSVAFSLAIFFMGTGLILLFISPDEYTLLTLRQNKESRPQTPLSTTSRNSK